MQSVLTMHLLLMLVLEAYKRATEYGRVEIRPVPRANCDDVKRRIILDWIIIINFP